VLLASSFFHPEVGSSTFLRNIGLRYKFGICLEGLRKSTKKLKQAYRLRFEPGTYNFNNHSTKVYLFSVYKHFLEIKRIYFQVLTVRSYGGCVLFKIELQFALPGGCTWKQSSISVSLSLSLSSCYTRLLLAEIVSCRQVIECVGLVGHLLSCNSHAQLFAPW
jgi:hypothetical protein